MAVIPFPSPTFQVSQGFKFADPADPTGTSVLTGLSPLTPDPTVSGVWKLGTMDVADAQLAWTAEAIERLIQQDLAGTSLDDKTKTVNASGTFAAFDVVISISGDTEVSVKVGSNGSWSIGKAASCADAIRLVPGHGVRWVPA